VDEKLDAQFPARRICRAEIVTKEYGYPAIGSMSKETYEQYMEDVKRSLLHSNRSFSIRMDITPVFGLPIRKNINVPREDFAEFLDHILAEEDFAKIYFPSVTKEDIIYDYARMDVLSLNSDELSEASAWNILNGMRDNFRGAEYFQQTSVASFYLRGGYRIPVQDGGGIVYSETVRLPYYGTDNAYFEEFLQRFDAVYVLDRETMEMKTYTSKADIRAICENICLIEHNRYNSIFTDTDSRYAVALQSVDKNDYENGISVFYVAHFLENRIPSCIK
jgi:hypothetical protein